MKNPTGADMRLEISPQRNSKTKTHHKKKAQRGKKTNIAHGKQQKQIVPGTAHTDQSKPNHENIHYLDEDSNRPKYADAILWGVFALVIRLSLLPYWKSLRLSGDELYYWYYACSAARGHFMNDYLHPPLWAFVLGLPALISDNPLNGRVLTVIISSISVSVAYLLGRYLFGRKVGWIASMIFSLYPNIIGFSHYLWPESLLSLLVLLAALLFFSSLGDERKTARFLFSFLILSLALLVKEFAVIPFGAMLLTVALTRIENKRRLIFQGVLIFVIPVIAYSLLASAMARRPIVLADAFIFNSNEADNGKIVWQRSTSENLKVLGGRVFEIYKMPRRFIDQVLNLWTPTSFPIFRLLKSREGYRNISHPRLLAYFALGMYLFVVGLGLVGMCCARKDLFLLFSIGNICFLSTLGLLFLMCSRFRISFMYLFIFYASTVLADFKVVLERLNWKRGLFLAFMLITFLAVVLLKRSSFGSWG